MCGFFAIHRRTGAGLENSGLAGLNSMTSRGPDSSGFELQDDGRLFLGHRRLAILDVSPNGHQPMISKSGRYTVVFNGEIYNHSDIRLKIEAMRSEAYCWIGSSDTETICAMLDFYDFDDLVPMLEGMFSICVYDHEMKNLLLARDRFGEKPLYFGSCGEDFIVSSVLDFIFIPEFQNKAAISESAISSYLTTTYIPQSQCIIQNMKKGLPGYTYKICLKTYCVRKKRYWSLTDEVRTTRSREAFSSSSEVSIVAKVEKLLSSSVKKQLISDRDIGAFLSGGIDSSLVCALAAEHISGSNLKTFTIGYEDGRYSEAHYAERIASHLGCDHKTMIVSPSMIIDAVSNISRFYDEPFADYSQVPTYLLSKLTSEHVTVALSGDGGDELFGGYNRYKYFKHVRSASKLPYFLKNISNEFIQNIDTALLDKVLSPFVKADSPGIKIQKATRAFLSSNTLEYYKSATQHGVAAKFLTNKLSFDRPDMEEYYSSLNDFLEVEKLMFLDCYEYLPSDILVKVDRASMASSLECRAPFLDPPLASMALSLPLDYKMRAGDTKVILKKILGKYIPKEYFERPKMGFGFPLDTWLRNDLREWAESILFENSMIEINSLLDSGYIKNTWRRHLEGQNRFSEIWTIIMLKSWLRERGF